MNTKIVPGFLLASVLALTVVSVTSCGVAGGILRDSNTVTRVDLKPDMKDLKFVRTVQGSASSGSVFCSIPLQGNLYARAMEDLHSNAKLQPNQLLLNLREDRMVKNYAGFYCEHSVTISADIFQFSR
jgi:hypothetical protein